MKAALRGHDFETQVQMLAPDGPNARDDAAVTAHAAAGLSAGGGKLPHLGQIQRSFGGYDISLVQAHTDAAAQHATTAMGARAYASGDHVVLGQGVTDLHTVAHEAAHVVQQKAGVSLSGGVGKAGDAHERHADAVADRVVAGQSADDLLAQYGGGGAGASSGGGVQLKEDEEAPVGTSGDKGGQANIGVNRTESNSAPACATSPEDVDHIEVVVSAAQIALTYAVHVKSDAESGVLELEDVAQQASRLHAAGAASRTAIRAANDAARTQQLIDAISGLGHVLGAVAGGGRLLVSAFKAGATEGAPPVLGHLDKLDALSGHMKNLFGVRSALIAHGKSNDSGPANATLGAVEAVDRRNDVQDDVIIDKSFNSAALCFRRANEHAAKAKEEINRGVKSAGKIRNTSDARLKQAIRTLGLAASTISDLEAHFRRVMPIIAAHSAGATHVAAAGSQSRTLLDWLFAEEGHRSGLALHRLQWKALVIPNDWTGHHLIDSDKTYCIQSLTPEAEAVLKMNAYIQLASGTYGVTNDVGETLEGLVPPKIADRDINKVYFRGQPYDEKMSLAAYRSDPDNVVRGLSQRIAMFGR